MEIDISEYLDEFIKETSEHLEVIDDLLMTLKNNKKNLNAINEIFRAAHSMKGMAASMEFKNMEGLTHRVEDILYEVRENGMDVTDEIVDNLFLGFNYVRELLESIENTASEDDVEIDKINILIEALDKILGKEEKKEISSNDIIELEDKDIELIEESIGENKKIYNIAVHISSSSALKSVRVFMTLNNLTHCGKIIKSKPDIEKFKQKDYQYNSTEVYAIVLSEKSKDEIEESIASISEIEYVQTKLIESKHDINFDLEIQNDIREEEVKPEYINICEFSNEINYKLDEIEIKIVGIDEFEDSYAEISDMYENFKDIFDLFSLTDLQGMKTMLNATKELINAALSSKHNLDIDEVDIILDSILLIKKVCSPDFEKQKNIFESKLKEHIDDINLMLNDKKIKNDIEIGEILLQKSNLKKNDITALLKKQREDYPDLKLGEIAIKEKKVSSKEVISALKDQKRIRSENHKVKKTEEIRIPALKADNLIDMLEELRIVQSQIEQEAMKNFNAESVLVRNLFRAFRITKEIQNLSISFRMVSLHQTFQKIRLSVRDTIKKLSKKIDFEINGENTELDRMLANRILDPLLHLVKNCVAHGIEDEETRQREGKNPKGNITMEAYTHKGYVYIEVSDDGKGIDTEVVYNKAKEKNIIDDKKQYSKDEIINFIFLPGFSTSEKVDKISGRGVGMDVVKTELSKLGGRINIETELGKGTKFILRVPKNMTALNGTVVSIDESKYIIPTNYIKEIFKIEDSRFVSIKGKRKMVKLRDSIIPVISHEVMGITPKEEKIMIVLEVDNQYKAMGVKDIIERRELVVKPLGEEFEDVGYIFGASILGDGKAALILDVERIFLNEEKIIN